MEALKLLISVSTIVVMVIFIERGEAQLSNNFYSKSCPLVETLVKRAVTNKFNQTFVAPQATLRLFFHDCFVQGCDASVMIFSENSDAEKDSANNLSLAGDGFDTVIKAKQAVESVCPGVVSCADIMAIAARDSVVITGGPSYSVELGRRDGLQSKSTDVPGNLPGPSFNLSQLVTMFSKHNLTQTDLIALSGAHTIGAAHCSKFAKRIYNFSSTNPIDPSLNSTYAEELKAKCPLNVNPNKAVSMDPTSRTFDNMYFQNLVQGKGMFNSDQVLYTDLASRPIVVGFANSPGKFNVAFVNAMIKLGRVGVKTGSQGNIRKNCAAFN